ncbi:MAG: carboxypeptidase-like regulatory domain-containing protein [Hymenobacter sp.]
MLNDKGEPLPSVVVAVKGTPTTTITNAAGNFLVAVEVADPVLVFTCAGYQAQALTGAGPQRPGRHALSDWGGAAVERAARHRTPASTG